MISVPQRTVAESDEADHTLHYKLLWPFGVAMRGLKVPQLRLRCHGWPGQTAGDRLDSFIATCVLLQSSVISGVWYHDM